MRATEAEVVETGERRDRRGRRVIPASRRAELLRAYESSGLTQAAFARREGLRYSTLAHWVQKLRRGGRRAVEFAEVQLPEAIGGAGLEVRLADGTLVRGSRVDALAQLVRALRG